MTKAEYKNIMAAMHAAYPNEKITGDERAVRMWWKYLENAEYKDVTASLSQHIKTSQFPPTIAELLDSTRRQNKFCNFLPRGYDFAKLERELLLASMGGARIAERKENTGIDTEENI